MDKTQQDMRFSFGKNWARFLGSLNEERIVEAETALQQMLRIETLANMTFLDIGSGSGLSSLAAARLGAEKIHSFDYDPHSVACTAELKRRYFPDFDQWTIEQGSALDKEYLTSLGQFEIVYSWGVLHHTGSMWEALENVHPMVMDNGILFISIYNHQNFLSELWHKVKKVYNRLPAPLRPVYTIIVQTPFEFIAMIKQLLQLKSPWQHWLDYKKNRGMSRWHDIVDWVGGYPFETATPEEIFRFYRNRGFILGELVTRQGPGCNEFVFKKPCAA